MRQQETIDPRILGWLDGSTPLDDVEIARLSAAHTRALDEAVAAVARQLNGPMTALLLYMGEIKQHSHQTERVCAMIKQIADTHDGAIAAQGRAGERETRSRRIKDGSRAPGVMLASGSEQKPLTKREREVLCLVSEGCSNKQGALQMQISPRTFESHRAEAMRKLGVRNTAELVRSALRNPNAA
jgi:DNA-binding CsgD family transcriptional regulator